MSAGIRISPELELPLDFVTQSGAILAKKRVGKSYTARRIVEQLLEAGQQVVILDPKGDWWGIRSAADGKGPGLPVTIFGGERGDVALSSTSGEVLARVAAEERVSMVVDLSSFRKHELATFCADFLETLYRLKAREEYRTPMMLVVDEGDAIAPQKPQPNEARMLGAADDIVRRGGQRGIGTLFVSQRSAVLNKNVLTQLQLLIVLRTISPQDMKALDDWIEVHGEAEQRRILRASLPSLPVGDAWFWSPGWPDDAGVFVRVHVDRITTFDSGATPKVGERRIAPKVLASVDLDRVRGLMASAIEEREANDPKKLRARIAELEEALAAPRGHDTRRIAELEHALELAAKRPMPVPERVEVPVVSAGDLVALGKLVEQLRELGPDIREVGESLRTQLARVSSRPAELFDIVEGGCVHYTRPAGDPMLEEARARPGYSVVPHGSFVPAEVPDEPPPRPFVPSRDARLPTPPPRFMDQPARSGAGPTALKKGAREMLRALVSMGRPLSRAQVATLAGLSPKSGTFSDYLSVLRTNRFVDDHGTELVATPLGVKVAGDVGRPVTTPQLVELWKSKFKKGARSMLEVLVATHPRGVTRDELARRVGISSASGTFSDYLSNLRSNGLIEQRGRELFASSSLFLGGRR